MMRSVSIIFATVIAVMFVLLWLPAYNSSEQNAAPVVTQAQVDARNQCYKESWKKNSNNLKVNWTDEMDKCSVKAGISIR